MTHKWPFSLSTSLAFAGILDDPRRFWSGVIGTAFSVFLMTFQSALFVGFRHAASVVIESVDADIWLMPKAVDAFDLSARPLDRRFEGLMLGEPYIETVRPMMAGFAAYLSKRGESRLVFVVGYDGPDWLGEAGIMRLHDMTSRLEGVLADRSDLSALSINDMPEEIEIGGRRATIVGSLEGFGSFLGCPYVFTTYRTSAQLLGRPTSKPSYVIGKLRPSAMAKLSSTLADLRIALPELEVKDKQTFMKSSANYWMVRTGAGGGIALAGVLGLAVGIFISAQVIYASISERRTMYATLRAIGAPKSFLICLVIVKALLMSIAGLAIGICLTVPAISLTHNFFISWILLDWPLIGYIVGLISLMSIAASATSLKLLWTLDPVSAFQD